MPLRILLADNNIAVQRMGLKILSAAGHDVVTVSNGVAAIKEITDFDPELLLLDVYLAGYDGLDLCRKVKGLPEMAKIPVLLTAGKTQPFRASDSARVSADGFINTPFEAGELVALVQRTAEHAYPEKATADVAHSAVAFPAQTVAAAASREQGTEVCDVCGCLNRKNQFACSNCDVPLPSSVTRPGNPAK